MHENFLMLISAPRGTIKVWSLNIFFGALSPCHSSPGLGAAIANERCIIITLFNRSTVYLSKDV